LRPVRTIERNGALDGTFCRGAAPSGNVAGPEIEHVGRALEDVELHVDGHQRLAGYRELSFGRLELLTRLHPQPIDFGSELFDAAQMMHGVGLLGAQRLFDFREFRLVRFGGGASAVELLDQLRMTGLGLLQLIE